jgi:hypothetical protein
MPDYPRAVIVLLFIVRCKKGPLGYRLFSLFNIGVKFFANSLIIRNVIGCLFLPGEERLILWVAQLSTPLNW